MRAPCLRLLCEFLLCGPQEVEEKKYMAVRRTCTVLFCPSLYCLYLTVLRPLSVWGAGPPSVQERTGGGVRRVTFRVVQPQEVGEVDI